MFSGRLFWIINMSLTRHRNASALGYFGFYLYLNVKEAYALYGDCGSRCKKIQKKQRSKKFSGATSLLVGRENFMLAEVFLHTEVVFDAIYHIRNNNLRFNHIVINT